VHTETQPQAFRDHVPQADLPLEGVGGVVVGGDFQGLGIARSLGRRGLPVCIIDDERSIGGSSRYTTRSVRVPDLRDEQKTVDVLMREGRRLNLKGWLLYPTRDETVATFARNRKVLSEWYRVPTGDWDMIQWAWDKRNTYRKALELDIPVPGTWFPSSVEEAREIDAEFPLVIKPAIKERFLYVTKTKAWLVKSVDELVKRFNQALKIIPAGEILVQELISGGSEQLHGYCSFFKEGQALGTMITQYKRQHPPLFGRTCTYVETVENPEIEKIALQFLRSINYYGLSELEFKLDPRDGEYKLIDVNARTWAYHSLGFHAGVDFPHMLFEDYLGREVESVRAPPGLTWIRLVTDLPVGVIGILRRQLRLRDYTRSITRFSTESVFSSDDPVPSIVETALIPYLIYKKGF
jgi:predicted ATP-grasp superfamily ATP-dependent carboligase